MNKIDFITALSGLRPSATFMHLHKYKNEAGEVADYNIVFNISYQSALERSIEKLQNYQTSSKIEEVAKQQLLDGYQASLKKLETHQADEKHYSKVFSSNGTLLKGVKLHNKSNTLHLYGALIDKRVISPPFKKGTAKKSQLAVAKYNLNKMTPLSAFRQFKITPNNLEKIVVDKISIIPSM